MTCWSRNIIDSPPDVGVTDDKEMFVTMLLQFRGKIFYYNQEASDICLEVSRADHGEVCSRIETSAWLLLLMLS